MLAFLIALLLSIYASQSSAPPTGLFVPNSNPTAECAGPWIPIALPNAVSAFCSACVNGTLFLFRVVDYSLPYCQNVSGRISQTCSFPCPAPTDAINITQVFLATGYLPSLFSTLLLPVSNYRIDETTQSAILTLSPCTTALNMSYVQLLLSNLLDEIYTVQSLPIPQIVGASCSVLISKSPFQPPPYALFSLLALSIVALVVIFAVVFIWKYYYASPLHALPTEISWSYLDYLTQPWKWTNRIEFNIREYQVCSP
jgi:hypothetical protein